MASDRDRASGEATDWLIRLQDDPRNPDLRRRFDDWHGDGPLNAEAWSATLHAADLIAKVPPGHADLWRDRIAAARASGIVRPIFGRGIGRLLAGAALAAGLAAFFLPTALLHLEADHVTGTGEVRRVALADGSTVTLAPASAIAVAVTAGERRVDLLAGEAFFEIVHDPARPFRVAAGGVETVDLGTGFDIRIGERGAVIAVQDGSVRVDRQTSSPAVSETLAAGQSIRLARTGEAVRSDGPPGQIAAWRRDQLIAQNQPMGEVVDQLRPYFAGRIVLTDGRLAERPVTGVYNLADPVEALRGIARAHGAAVRRITPWVVLISRE